ncbi:MAG TPA: tetratricopeptide repeat protein, partial [Lamprocystis sp. (in: g-proteobacteria)]|nr:tetratricopeptide repeat protein [Lamprocystis sp. (in: g-proteobacteria)]
HMVVYGERGSGKSFLVRLVQLEAEALAAVEEAPVAVALLPEEQYNIRSEARLIEALTATLDAQGSNFSYAYDSRTPQVAWEEALQGLNAALDRRFGPGRGLLVAAIENFDGLSRTLFGTGKDGKTRVAAEQRSAEERLRQLMSAPQSRLMLLATATGTVDMDYERPLFQAFKTIELTPWTSDTCIAYFNRRRELEQAPPLTAVEGARARTIAEFIGGNPRLAQLLGEVLVSPEARTIAQTLDALSDQLADYYRRRLDDLPPAATGLLDALIRQGEPCSQSELAVRVNQRQNQIADAFGSLNEGRLLLAERAKGGASQLYRVRDRLFVHFYRRRYGDGSQANALARIAELLETFFTADEKAEWALRHLDAGEPTEARFYLDLRRRQLGELPGLYGYLDQDSGNETCPLFMLANVAAADLEQLRVQLRDCPEDAYIYWTEATAAAGRPLSCAAAAGLRALAASRCGLDERAGDILREALSTAESNADPDARILLLDQLAPYNYWRLHDEDQAIVLAGQAGGLADAAGNELVRMIGLLRRAWAVLRTGHQENAIKAANQAATLAQGIDWVGGQATALLIKAYALGDLRRYDEAIATCDQAATLAERSESTRSHADILARKGWSLGQLGRHQDAIVTLDEAIRLAEQAGYVRLQARILRSKGWDLGETRRYPEANSTLNQAAALAEQVGDLGEQAEIFHHKAFYTWKQGHPVEALDYARTAIRTADQSADTTQRQRSRQVFFQIAVDTPAADLLEHLAAALTLPVEDPRWLHPCLSDIMAATTQAGLWRGLAALIETHRKQVAGVWPSGCFRQVGPVWAAQARAQGRAATFAAVARELPTIAQVMGAIPLPWRADETDSRATPRRDLFDGLIAACDDPGLLGDIADLIPDVFGLESSEEAERLRTFATYHAAPDKAAFLQRCDPDLAIAIRNIWGSTEPPGQADRGLHSKR